jgi:hypothetical protein
MNNATIQAIMLASGFKLKDQGAGRLDLNPYVYDAAQALLGAFQAEQAACGLVTVPAVPTPAMVEAAFAGKMEPQDCLGQARRREAMAADYMAMLAAAPQRLYDFSGLQGRAGSNRVFEITIETEAGCDIDEGEYGVRVTNLLGSWLDSGDQGLIEDAVAEVVGDLALPEEGHTTFIAYESGERDDVFWNKYFLIAAMDAVTAKEAQPHG